MSAVAAGLALAATIPAVWLATRPGPPPQVKAKLPDEVTVKADPEPGIELTIFALAGSVEVDQIHLRGRNNGGAEISGDLSPRLGSGQYQFKYREAHIGTETPPVIHIRGLRFEIDRRVSPGAAPITLARIARDLDLREGQKTVLGKPAALAAGSLLLVAAARAID